MQMDFSRVVNAYLAMRAKREQIKKAYDAEDTEIKAQMAKVEGVLLRHLNETGSESTRTAVGTFFRQEEIKPSVQDWSALYDFIREEDAFDALERRVKTQFVKEYMESNDGALPPGVSVHREYKVRVRRAD